MFMPMMLSVYCMYVVDESNACPMYDMYTCFSVFHVAAQMSSKSSSYIDFLIVFQIHLKVFDDTQYSAKDQNIDQQQPQPSTSNTDSES